MSDSFTRCCGKSLAKTHALVDKILAAPRKAENREACIEKMVTISCCADCPHMDYEYYDYLGDCDLLNRDLSKEISIQQGIHSECPLPNYEAKEKK